jgi:hypothetical protein
LEIVDPARAEATLASIFGPKGPPPTLTFEGSSGQVMVFFGPWSELCLSPLTIDGVLPEDPDDERLSGLRILLGSREQFPSVPCIAPERLAPPGVAKRLNGGAGVDFAMFPAALLNYLLRHYGKAVVHPPSVRPVRRVTPRMAAIQERNDPGLIPRDELLGLTPLEKVEYALEQIGIRTRETESGQLVSQCPLHFGERENFSISETSDGGPVLIYCHRCECEASDLVQALGLYVCDLFPVRDFRRAHGSKHRRSNVTDDHFKEGVSKVTDAMADAWADEAERYKLTLRSQYEEPDRDRISAKKMMKDIWKHYDYYDPYFHDSSMKSPEHPDYRLLLSQRLGLPVEALEKPLGLGIRLINRSKQTDGSWVDLGPAWTWPEFDAKGRVVGIMRRFVNPSVSPKKMAIGGRHDTGHLSARGLVHNLEKKDLPGPIFVVEGESDFCALAWQGQAVIGRPGSKGGIVEVAKLLRDDPRDVVVIGENDRKPDGLWPGNPEPYASRLASRLPGRSIKTLLPPQSFKDIREYLISGSSSINQGVSIR